MYHQGVIVSCSLQKNPCIYTVVMVSIQSLPNELQIQPSTDQITVLLGTEHYDRATIEKPN